MEDLELKEIRQYHGTAQYWDVMGANVTDGVKYVMDNGYAWVITDAVAILRMVKKVANQPFVVIQSKLEKDDAVSISYSDGNGNELYKQNYSWSNAKAEIKLYYSDKVLMLTGEW